MSLTYSNSSDCSNSSNNSKLKTMPTSISVAVDDVVEGIYALTAMSSLADSAQCPLLHPGHRDALLRTVNDSLGILLGLAPQGSLALTASIAGAYTFAVHEALDAPSVKETVRSALCHITVWIIRRAAGLTRLDVPDFFVGLLTLPAANSDGKGSSPGSGSDSDDKDEKDDTVYAPAVISRCDY